MNIIPHAKGAKAAKIRSLPRAKSAEFTEVPNQRILVISRTLPRLWTLRAAISLRGLCELRARQLNLRRICGD